MLLFFGQNLGMLGQAAQPEEEGRRRGGVVYVPARQVIRGIELVPAEKLLALEGSAALETRRIPRAIPRKATPYSLELAPATVAIEGTAALRNKTALHGYGLLRTQASARLAKATPLRLGLITVGIEGSAELRINTSIEASGAIELSGIARLEVLPHRPSDFAIGFDGVAVLHTRKVSRSPEEDEPKTDREVAFDFALAAHGKKPAR